MLAADVFRHRLEIDLRLAGAGDAVEQRDGIAALRHGGAQGIGGGELAERQVGLGEVRIGRLGDRLGRQYDGFERAFVDQPVDHAGGHAGLARGVALRARQPIAE